MKALSRIVLQSATNSLVRPTTYCSSSQSQKRISKWSTPTSPSQTSSLHTSPGCKGLEEFFPKTKDIIEEGERAGRSWSASELRQKSNEDLHKLWYVLLKERNMLLTLEKEANRLRYHIPAPTRKHKVVKAMARLKLVLHERYLAIAEAKKQLGMVSDEDLQDEGDRVASPVRRKAVLTESVQLTKPKQRT